MTELTGIPTILSIDEETSVKKFLNTLRLSSFTLPIINKRIENIMSNKVLTFCAVTLA